LILAFEKRNLIQIKDMKLKFFDDL